MTKETTAVLVFLIAWAYMRSQGGASAPGKKRTAPASQGTQRNADRTPQAPGAARTQIAASYREVTGQEPSPEALAMLMAHSAGETGRWRKMVGWNYGFVTTLGGHDWFQLPGNPLLFKWYASAADGCRDWLETIRDNFPDAWAVVGSGDAAAYVLGLHRGKHGSYFGDAPVAAYERLVRSLFTEYLPAPIASQAAAQAAKRPLRVVKGRKRG